MSVIWNSSHLSLSHTMTILLLQQMKCILRWAAAAFKMTIIFLSWILTNLRPTLSFTTGKAILSSQNAFNNETALARYIKELKLKSCTLYFQKKNSTTEFMKLNYQNWECRVKNRKLQIQISLFQPKHKYLVSCTFFSDSIWTRSKPKFHEIQVTECIVEEMKEAFYSSISQV